MLFQVMNHVYSKFDPNRFDRNANEWEHTIFRI